MLTEEAAKEIRGDVYDYVAVPICIFGIMGNLLILVMWGRKKYHPTRFLFMVALVAQLLSTIFTYVWYRMAHATDRSKTTQFVLIVTYFPKYFASNVELLMVVVHCLWLSYSHKEPFFSRKWIIVEVFTLLAWSVLLRTVNVTSDSITDVVRLRLRIVCDTIGMVLPEVLQLGVLVALLRKQRSRNKWLAKLRGQRPRRWRGNSAEVEAGPEALPQRHGKSNLLNVQNRLTTALMILTLVSPFFRTVPLMATFYYRAQEKADPAMHLAEASRLVTQAIDHSWHIVYFFFIFPSIRRPFLWLYSRACCRNYVSESVAPLPSSTRTSTVDKRETPVKRNRVDSDDEITLVSIPPQEIVEQSFTVAPVDLSKDMSGRLSLSTLTTETTQLNLQSIQYTRSFDDQHLLRTNCHITPIEEND